jgi:hypothetical protein
MTISRQDLAAFLLLAVGGADLHKLRLRRPDFPDEESAQHLETVRDPAVEGL